MTPKEIGEAVADAGALLSDTDECKAIKRTVADFIRQERRAAALLTKAEAKVALEAIGQMTDGNARDFREWASQTCGTRAEWRMLLRAEAKLRTFVNGERTDAP